MNLNLTPGFLQIFNRLNHGVVTGILLLHNILILKFSHSFCQQFNTTHQQFYSQPHFLTQLSKARITFCKSRHLHLSFIDE